MMLGIGNYGRWVFTVIAIFFFSACASGPQTQSFDFSGSEALDEALVVVIKDPRSERALSNLNGPGYRAGIAYQDDPILHRYASRIAVDHSVEIVSEWPLRSLGVHCFLVSAATTSSKSALQDDERVLWVQPFNEFELKGEPSSDLNNNAKIRDLFLKEFNAKGQDVQVAVVDTGVDKNHPDLVNSALAVQNFSGSRGQPDNELHGTAVVGLIAANPQSHSGIQGIASGAQTHLLRGCWQDEEGKGRCNTLTLALALDAAIELRPDVINLSLSGGHDRVLDELIAKLTAQGTLVVAAYDEKRELEQRFPSPRAGVIYAFGLDSPSQQTPPSKNVLIAPRHAISLAPMSGYDFISGHSIAAPQLTGMAAVLIGIYKQEPRGQIVARLDQWLGNHYMLP